MSAASSLSSPKDLSLPTAPFGHRNSPVDVYLLQREERTLTCNGRMIAVTLIGFPNHHHHSYCSSCSFSAD